MDEAFKVLKDMPSQRMSRRKFLLAAGMTGLAVVETTGRLGAVVGEPLKSRGFEIGPAGGRHAGFAVAGLQAHDPLGDHIDQEGHLARDLFGVTDFICKSSAEKGDVLDQLWVGGGGSVRVWAQIERGRRTATGGHEESGRMAPLSVRLRVENGYRFNIRTISFHLPWFIAPRPAHTRILDSCCGGRRYPWRGGSGDDGPSYYRYSALVAFYDELSRAGLCVDFFDDEFRQSGCAWRIEGSQCRATVHSYLNLSKGRSTTLDYHMRPYSDGMPDIALDDYRQRRLAPCMARYGMVEAKPLETRSPWACTGWPFPDLVKQVASAKALGANGYIQWAPPDGQGFYEPFPERLAWFKELRKASRLGIPIGVLIDPRFSPRIDQSNRAWALDKKFLPGRVVPMAAEADASLAYLLKMRNNLAADGVSVAFWDTGGLPYPSFTPEGYVTLLEQWKRAGIRIMPEVSRDYSAWITGVALNWGLAHGVNGAGSPFTFADPPRCEVLRRTTPRAKMFRGGILSPLAGQGGRNWWEAFANDASTITILSTGVYAAKPVELEVWAKSHG